MFIAIAAGDDVETLLSDRDVPSEPGHQGVPTQPAPQVVVAVAARRTWGPACPMRRSLPSTAQQDVGAATAVGQDDSVCRQWPPAGRPVQRLAVAGARDRAREPRDAR